MTAHRKASSLESSTGTSNSGSRPQSRTSRDRSTSDASGRSKSRNGRHKNDLAKAMAEGTASSRQGTTFDELNPPAMPFVPRSPGTPNFGFQPSPIPSPITGSGPTSRANSRTVAQGYFDTQNLQPIQIGADIDIGLSPRPSPFSINSTPSLSQTSPGISRANTPTSQGFQSQGPISAARKRSINKSEISEPTLISATSRITTQNLPPGASLRNGSDLNAPSIPPQNPRRKTRAVKQKFK